jgi:hypothetical protein
MKYIIILISIIAVLGISVAILNTINPVWWQDIKLSSTQWWGVATVSNNPLLPGQDADLQSIESTQDTYEPRIDPNLLRSGGPPKDGIPSIDDPQFESINETQFADDELIIGVEIDGEARAYPYAILNWHEIVNDTLAGVPIALTYCPLCETNSVFHRELDGEVVEFGVSGKLFQSCLVMYDRTSDSLFAQAWGLGVGGKHTNTALERIDAIRTTIGEWRAAHPDSQILTTNTGYSRNYDGYPYGSYYTNEQILFDARNQHNRENHPKAIMQAVFTHHEFAPKNQFAGEAHTFTQDEVQEAGSIEFTYQGDDATAQWNDTYDTIEFIDANGNTIPNMALFGFVYPAYFE